MATSPSTLNLVTKKNAKSVVWQYFGLEADKKNIQNQKLEDQPVCRKCYKWVRAKHGNTSNLLSHLHANHPNKYTEASKLIQKGESSRLPRELNRAVDYFLAKDMQPLYTVEKAGFKHLVSKLNLKYSLPSQRYVLYGDLTPSTVKWNKWYNC